MRTLPSVPTLYAHVTGAAGRDVLILGLGDFVVFAVFAAQASRDGIAPLIAVSTGVLAGLIFTMTHVALKWPGSGSSLSPAIPLSVAFGAMLLVAERFALRPLADTLAVAGVVL